jgi:hypothetical protein
MGEQYRIRDDQTSTLELTIPEAVNVALPGDRARSAGEGLLALSVGTDCESCDADGGVGHGVGRC